MKGDIINNDRKDSSNSALVASNNEKFSETLPIFPLKNQVVFPTLHTSMVIRADSMNMLDSALKGDRLLGIVGLPDAKSELPLSKQVYNVGTVVKITYVTRAPEDSTVIVAEGLKRFRVAQWLSEKPYLKARIALAPEVIEADLESEALHRNLRDLCQEVFSMTITAPK